MDRPVHEVAGRAAHHEEIVKTARLDLLDHAPELSGAGEVERRLHPAGVSSAHLEPVEGVEGEVESLVFLERALRKRVRVPGKGRDFLLICEHVFLQCPGDVLQKDQRVRELLYHMGGEGRRPLLQKPLLVFGKVAQPAAERLEPGHASFAAEHPLEAGVLFQAVDVLFEECELLGMEIPVGRRLTAEHPFQGPAPDRIEASGEILQNIVPRRISASLDDEDSGEAAEKHAWLDRQQNYGAAGELFRIAAHEQPPLSRTARQCPEHRPEPVIFLHMYCALPPQFRAAFPAHAYYYNSMYFIQRKSTSS